MPFDLGNTARLAATCTDAGGTATNATGVTLTITLPDGTTVTPAVTNPPATTGKYTYDYATTQAGRHSVRWLFTGPACAYTDVLDVRAAAPVMLFSLADGKAQLDIPASSTSYDDEIRHYIEATTAAVEYFVGPVVPRTVTQVLQGGREAWVLHSTPVIAVTSVTPVQAWALDVDLSVLDVDTETGVVRRTDGVWFYSGDYRVAYRAGRTATNPNISLAGKLILQHLWRTQYGAARGPSAADDFLATEQVPGFGYAIPNRALQLLQNDRQEAGFA
ncbi:hypothetical protein ABZX77_40735 [Streptomyces sp. NPDC004237]|uniref:hypothetical protein n=1 Tax=Streptomyces sp. NPDC004237 TaxID=3154455 RepID=UPI0033A01D78